MNIVFSPSTISSFNLSAEEYLFKKTGENFLFLYKNDPSVIIGSNQAIMNEVDIDYCIDNNITIIRRMSGGGAVYHDNGNINYSFIHDKTGAPLSAQFLEPIIEVLHSMEIPVEVGKRKDIWLEGYKISGTASHVSKGRELHHGTLLYHSDLIKLQNALSSKQKDITKKATASVPSPVINIYTYLLNKNRDVPTISTFLDDLTDRLLCYFNVLELATLHDSDIELIEELRRSKYTNREWNYRM
ncbi:MAG: lipoate--protein ligase family protein [Fermentimonas sp.]|nr:lipoate--protein ligase family protein [Fermentimonas sp.]